jgi:hypothetical protein
MRHKLLSRVTGGRIIEGGYDSTLPTRTGEAFHDFVIRE